VEYFDPSRPAIQSAQPSGGFWTTSLSSRAR
jgi:hypothetical protein